MDLVKIIFVSWRMPRHSSFEGYHKHSYHFRLRWFN